ncbi:hypothetical protein LEMLEM_LOCUS5016 [Lemmus lemmus]
MGHLLSSESSSPPTRRTRS